MNVNSLTEEEYIKKDKAETKSKSFELYELIRDLKHFLPSQAPLKDFVHHNTLHAFQNLNFHDALRKATAMFGYKVYLSLEEFRQLYKGGKISHLMLEKVIAERKGASLTEEFLEKAINKTYEIPAARRIGVIRENWKTQYKTDLDSLVHPPLFRILGSYLDQGISIWNFPILDKGLLDSIREMEQKSFTSFFRTKKARDILFSKDLQPEKLLKIIVGDERCYRQYLFDQQFAHPGWSGMVSMIEDEPQSLLAIKKISLYELILFELLLEADALYYHLGDNWKPLCSQLKAMPEDLFAETPETGYSEMLAIWQEAFEWTYYDQVLAGLKQNKNATVNKTDRSFQAMFCIDDRETSLRDYLETSDPACETFGTPGFFNVEFFFQPEQGKFYTKQCPAPVTPKYLIKEVNKKSSPGTDIHFHKQTHTIIGGWLVSQTLGFWSALKLFINIFWPSGSPATTDSFNHMDKGSKLSIENAGEHESGLQIGFTRDEMAQRVENLLRSIGLVKDFAPLIYVIGHGSSSVNNPHYAAYDCGACSGRPGSVNARVFSYMANHPEVRALLSVRGIDIPKTTQFIGGLHDTCRDEICFYDEDLLSPANGQGHEKTREIFSRALALNAKERSRRLETINTLQSPEKIRKDIGKRSVSLFEPRPELNHATNSLCIVGRRNLTKNLFLDRRAFLNSYDYRLDPDGDYLLTILKAAAPVCGGINLEYYFSRVDNQKLGAGTKLPHNVMGLFGVANGTEGDLRPGLPSQMIEVHDPLRLLLIVEHFPDVVLKTIKTSDATYEWFINEWIKLTVVNPETGKTYWFDCGEFTEYETKTEAVAVVPDILSVIESTQENIPVCIVS